MTVIIRDVLTGPPSSLSAFRDITLFCDLFLGKPVVIESVDPDPYYRWLRPRGGMDFVQDFVRPGTERGLRIVDTTIKPEDFMTIVVRENRIVAENLHNLITMIRLHG